MRELLLATLIPAVGLALPLVALIKVTKVSLKEVLTPALLGLGLLVLTLVLQPAIQVAPAYLLSLSTSDLRLIIYATLVSGFFQEGIKYLAVRRYLLNLKALWIGGGFGLGEAALVTLSTYVATYSGLLSGYPAWAFLASAYERLTAVIFHVCSAAILATPYWRATYRYLTLALIHSLINFTPTLAKLVGLGNITTSPYSAIFIYAVISAVVIPLAYVTYRVIKSKWLSQ